MRVLVTGGAGFIGSHIVDELVRNGAEVAVVDNLSGGGAGWSQPSVRFYKTDILSENVAVIFERERPDYVIHQAAQVSVATSISNSVYDVLVNVMGTLNVLENCRRHGVKKVVFASSAAVYGDPIHLPISEEHPTRPLSPYAVSKSTAEHFLQVYRGLYDLDFTVLRYANVYGPRQSPRGDGGVVAMFTRRIAEGQPVRIFGEGMQTRDFVYVCDVARANVLALKTGSGEVLNVSTGTETTVKELCDMIATVCKSEVNIEYASERPGEIRRSILANDRAKAVLQWAPQVSLEDGLTRTLAHEFAHAITR